MGIIAKQSIKGALANYLGVLIGAFTTFFVVTDLLTQEEIGLTRVMVDAAMLFAGLAQLGTNASILRFYPHFCTPDKPELREAAVLLPPQVTGAFYFADDKRNLCEVGGWDCADNSIEAVSYSPRELAESLIGELLFSPLRMLVDGVLKLPPPKRQTPMFAALPRTAPREELALRRKALTDFGAELAGKADKAGTVSPKFPDLVSFGRPEPGIPKFPVACEVPNPKRSRIGVLFADGTIEFYDFKAESLKHLCSFLHTRRRYEEKVFIRLIKRAVELDKQRKGSADERRTPAKSN